MNGASQPQKRNFRKATILVVEDNADHQVLVKRALKQHIPEVTPVCLQSTPEALAYLNGCLTQNTPLPKMILLDLMLPQAQDGWAFLEGLKTLPTSCPLPVVVLSSSTDENDVTKAYDLGANSFIQKPVDYNGWNDYFRNLRGYWWETVTLP